MKKANRPRTLDANQWAKRIVELSTGEVDEAPKDQAPIIPRVKKKKAQPKK